jgi:hypothetical protein
MATRTLIGVSDVLGKELLYQKKDKNYSKAFYLK